MSKQYGVTIDGVGYVTVFTTLPSPESCVQCAFKYGSDFCKENGSKCHSCNNVDRKFRHWVKIAADPANTESTPIINSGRQVWKVIHINGKFAWIQSGKDGKNNAIVKLSKLHPVPTASIGIGDSVVL